MAQGFYNTFTTTAIVFIIVTYFILQILQAIIVSKVNLDFTLATKVHASGQLLIVWINKRGREIFKLYMNEIDQLQDKNSLMADKVNNQWNDVEDKSHLNDFSDSGMNSCN